ncbi:MAG: hypothetical protein ACRD16_06070 [Thermoanaerobaculia bacterium]
MRTTPGVRFEIILMALVAMSAAALSFHFFVGPLRPWPDQGWQLQAAIRHSEGLGLTSQGSVPDKNLEQPTYRRLSYFPPLFSLVVSWLLTLGLSAGRAVKVVNLAALLFGSAAWIRLAADRLQRRSSVALFAVLLVAVDGALVPKGGTTDYVMWALLPLWAICLLRIDGRRAFATQAALSAGAGAVLAVVAGFRWAGLFLVPAGCLFLLAGNRAGRAKQRLALAFLHGLPPTAAFFAMSLANRHSSGEASYLDSLKSHWSWGKLATLFPLRSVTTIPLGWDSLLLRLARGLDPSGGRPVLALLLCGIPAAGVLLIVVASLRRKPVGEATARAASGDAAFGKLAGLVVVCYVSCLAIFAVRYSWPGLLWSYLEEPRYFRPLLPLAALAGIGAFELSSRKWRRVALAASWAGALYLIQADSRWERTFLTQRDESWELVKFVDGLAARPGPNVVFDTDVSDYIIRPHPNVVAFLNPAPETVGALRASRRVDVWLVRRTRERSSLEPDPDYDAKRFDALRARFSATLAWQSSGGSFEVYRGASPPSPPLHVMERGGGKA